MSTYDLRTKLVTLERQDVGKVEVSKNQAPWIAKFWPATTYPGGHKNKEPYCAAAQCYWIMRWLSDEEVLCAFDFTASEAEAWRPKSAAVKDWLPWAKAKGLEVLPKKCILHTGDLVIYSYSHIELVVDDDGTDSGAFVTIGFNTDPGGSRDGEGCFEKPRKRDQVKGFIRMLQ